MNPVYLAALGGVTDSTGKNPILTSPATPANVAILQAHVSGASIPAFFQSAAALSTTATIAQGLVAFPQYAAVADTWGAYVGNFSYHSFQLTVLQRFANGLSFNINYTYSKNVGDDGPFRTGFDLPAAAISNNIQNWKQNRIDRSWTTISTPQSLHAFGVYQLPFGRGHLGGGSSLLVRSLISGWQFSGIYTYASGTPFADVWNGCGTGNANSPGQGQCMPDLNPSYLGRNARTNSSYGSGPHGFQAANLGTVQYVDVNAFQQPKNVSTVSSAQYLIGNAPRTRPWNLNNPGSQNLDTALRRSFGLPREMALVFEVDCLNTWNKVTFAGPSAIWSANSATFGTIGGLAAGTNPRDFQFAGHFNF